MRQYDKERNVLLAIQCNCCGRLLKVENGIAREGCFYGMQDFGYFSTMDGQRHSFELCEACYRKITGKFKIPVNKEDITELL